MKPKTKKHILKRKWIVLPALLASVACARAQSSDAIIDKLVEKGILSVKEANDLREETDKNFTQSYSVKSGLPDWVNSLKFSGDIRGRYDGIFNPDHATFTAPLGVTNGIPDRARFRFRLRFGATVTMLDNVEMGFRLTSGDTPSGFSTGNPLSGNSTMQDNGTKKGIFIDTAYGKWSPLNGPDWTGVITVGKMENPFQFDEMVFDPDYTPEGAAVNLGYRVNDQHLLKLNAGTFILDELSLTSSDPFLPAAQVRWEAAWNKKVSSSVGIAGLIIENADTLTNSVVPNVNIGNTRNADGRLTYKFNPIVADGSVTYLADSFPLYKGAFPIRFSGEYIVNPAAPSSATVGGYKAENYGWNAGIVFGKSGKKGTWDLSYNYRWLGGNAWYEELVDDDFGAFWGTSVVSGALANSPPFSGASGGYASGTNIKGHVLRMSYSPTDSVTLAAKCFLTELINPFPGGTPNRATRLQVDAMWKF